MSNEDMRKKKDTVKVLKADQPTQSDLKSKAKDRKGYKVLAE